MAALVAVAYACDTLARLPQDAPPLAPPIAEVYEVIEVSSAQELAEACWNLSSNQAIVISPGTYDLGGVNFPNGVDGRLTVGRFGAAGISNIQIRGATGNPADVVLQGRGMLDPTVPFGIQIFTATDVTIADLTVRDVYYHVIAIQGDQGARDVRLYHSRFLNAGQQIIKASGAGADDVTIDYNEIAYTQGAVVHPEGSPANSCYTNGIDALGVSGWKIRHNLLDKVRCQNGDLAGPAILMWRGSRDTLIAGNTFRDSSRGPYLGFEPSDHANGVVQNNFISWSTSPDYQVDVGIYSASSDSVIEHNTVLVNGNYPNAIEIRYAGATNVRVANNLLDGEIRARDGAAPLLEDNEVVGSFNWFVDPDIGDLHLTEAGSLAAGMVSAASTTPGDFDGVVRGDPTNPGADQYGVEAPLFYDGFE